MALSQRLQIRQSQALVMTPQLMQAIKLLQLSNLDLVAYVEAELERNPLLDRGAEAEPAGEPEGAPAAEQPAIDRDSGASGGEPGTALDSHGGGDAAEDRATDFDDDGEPILPRPSEGPAGYSEWAATGSGGRDDADYNLEAFVSTETTLADWLREQLTLAISDPVRRMIGQYLIDLVDESGYLAGDLAAAAEKLGTSLAEVEAVLAILQTFDPPGICARDLAECLAIQLKDNNRYDPAMQALISRLDLLAKRDFPALKKICGVGDEDLADMIADVRRLNPKPGLAFGAAFLCGRRQTAPGWSSSIPTRCRRSWSIRATMPKYRQLPGVTLISPISPIACKARPGLCARSISGPAQSSRSATKSSASRTLSSRMASSICARSI